jgi:hypothetical protein
MHGQKRRDVRACDRRLREPKRGMSERARGEVTDRSEVCFKGRKAYGKGNRMEESKD